MPYPFLPLEQPPPNLRYLATPPPQTVAIPSSQPHELEQDLHLAPTGLSSPTDLPQSVWQVNAGSLGPSMSLPTSTIVGAFGQDGRSQTVVTGSGGIEGTEASAEPLTSIKGKPFQVPQLSALKPWEPTGFQTFPNSQISLPTETAPPRQQNDAHSELLTQTIEPPPPFLNAQQPIPPNQTEAAESERPKSSSEQNGPEQPQPQNPTEVPLELFSNQQSYDTFQQVLTAIGNVLMRFQASELKADRLQTTIADRRVVAEGNITLTRGNQVLMGDRIEYSLENDQGRIFKPRGVIFLPSSDRDFSLDTPSTNSLGSNPLNPLNDPVQSQDVNLDRRQQRRSGSIRQIRFEADRIDFTSGTWQAINIRITPDPFSPAELELRADRAQLMQISESEDRIQLKRPRLVFDQGLSIPVLQSRLTLSDQRRDPFTIRVGFDQDDRGGFFIGRRFTPLDNRRISLVITPQFFLEEAIDQGFDLSDPDLYGLTLGIRAKLAPRTVFKGFGSLSSFDLPNIDDNLRSILKLQQWIGPNQLSAESAFRERVVNGSLGEQEVRNRNGVIFHSTNMRLGQTGLDLSYRLGAELITADTDAIDLEPTDTLGRFQASFNLSRAFVFWQGEPLPPTSSEGLRYTGEPLIPFLRLVAGLTGVTSVYTNSDSQNLLIGNVRLEGALGRFSRPYFDYTAFNIGYSQGAQVGESPFLFDRVVDQQVVSAGLLQQIYGPIRAGFQTSINVDTGELFNTDIILDYSRRTYGLSFRYNLTLDIASVLFRLSDFNFVGNRGPLTSPEVGAVEAGVQQTNDPF